MRMFSKILVAALSASLVYFLYKEVHNDNIIETTVDPITERDITSEPDNIDIYKNNFTQPSFENYEDACMMSKIVRRTIRYNGYISTTYMIHIACALKGISDVSDIEVEIQRLHGDYKYGYTSIDSFKELYNNDIGDWVVTLDKPIRLSTEDTHNDNRQGENSSIL